MTAGLLQEMMSSPWAIDSAVLQSMIDAARNPQASRAASRGSGSPSVGTVAVLPVYGVIKQRSGGLLEQFFGGTSTQSLAYQFRRLMADDSVKAIILDVDSPGGTAAGVPELADEIFAARGRKKTIAVANSLNASAAYWISSQTDQVVVTPSAIVGSIGVIAMHEDVSGMADKLGVKVTLITAGKYKGEASPFAPLTDAARAAEQRNVDEIYGLFVNAVARGRKTTAAAVRAGYGEGRAVSAKQAIASGLADRIATLDQVLRGLTGGAISSGGNRAREGNGLTWAQRRRLHEAVYGKVDDRELERERLHRRFELLKRS